MEEEIRKFWNCCCFLLPKLNVLWFKMDAKKVTWRHWTCYRGSIFFNARMFGYVTIFFMGMQLNWVSWFHASVWGLVLRKNPPTIDHFFRLCSDLGSGVFSNFKKVLKAIPVKSESSTITLIWSTQTTLSNARFLQKLSIVSSQVCTRIWGRRHLWHPWKETRIGPNVLSSLNCCPRIVISWDAWKLPNPDNLARDNSEN